MFFFEQPANLQRKLFRREWKSCYPANLLTGTSSVAEASFVHSASYLEELMTNLTGLSYLQVTRELANPIYREIYATYLSSFCLIYTDPEARIMDEFKDVTTSIDDDLLSRLLLVEGFYNPYGTSYSDLHQRQGAPVPVNFYKFPRTGVYLQLLKYIPIPSDRINIGLDYQDKPYRYFGASKANLEVSTTFIDVINGSRGDASFSVPAPLDSASMEDSALLGTAERGDVSHVRRSKYRSLSIEESFLHFFTGPSSQLPRNAIQDYVYDRNYSYVNNSVFIQIEHSFKESLAEADSHSSISTPVKAVPWLGNKYHVMLLRTKFESFLSKGSVKEELADTDAKTVELNKQLEDTFNKFEKNSTVMETTNTLDLSVEEHVQKGIKKDEHSSKKEDFKKKPQSSHSNKDMKHSSERTPEIKMSDEAEEKDMAKDWKKKKKV